LENVQLIQKRKALLEFSQQTPTNSQEWIHYY
jgi:hypothetical protein